MEVYLVGGAVRDALLNIPAHEKDWLIVGGSPEQLLDQGYTQVGKDFPVFLHPQTHEEYALARTERKKGQGHKGFTFHTSPDVSIEEDLKRRDLTINAIAQKDNGELVDPYKGQQDIENKTLRHVSEAFSEDPLRVLRVARFAAKFHAQQFSIATETLTLMREISLSGELETLPAERVWQETHKALKTESPQTYFNVLHDCGALSILMPELDDLFGIPQPKNHHPEIDCGIHALLSLQQAARLTHSTSVRLAALIHDLGKATTPSHILPRHIGHEKRSLPLIKQFCQRISAPNDHQNLALIAAEYHTHCHRSQELRPKTVYKVLKVCRALQDNQILENFLQVCEADAKGRTGFENTPYPQAQRFRDALIACQGIQSGDLRASGLEGKQLGLALEKQRINAIKKITRAAKSNS